MPVLKGKIMELPNGKKVELFYIGVLAEALGRTTQTVRKWELSGAIPPTIFRDKSGRRMYSKEQIDIITALAEKACIAQGSGISMRNFRKWVSEAMNELKKKYLRKRGTSYEKTGIKKEA